MLWLEAKLVVETRMGHVCKVFLQAVMTITCGKLVIVPLVKFGVMIHVN
jgi:hypothetical protein